MTTSQTILAGRYRLHETLGQGGMGRVWIATDELLHRQVAVKEVVMPAGLTADEIRETSARASREARAAARLSHPNVVIVYDIVLTDTVPWIVMEYLPSRSLDQKVVQDGPMTAGAAARVGLDVLAAMRAASRVGVLHRDIKPSNVLLTDDGRVVLTDFGLATIVGDPAVTRTGTIFGSPSYMAPERARDAEANEASDLWSLGATLYFAVEGRSPYQRGSALATVAALASEEPDRATRAGALQPVLDGLLRRDPTTRLTPGQLKTMLQGIVDSAPDDRPAGRAAVPQQQEKLSQTQVMQAYDPDSAAPAGAAAAGAASAGAAAGKGAGKKADRAAAKGAARSGQAAGVAGVAAEAGPMAVAGAAGPVAGTSAAALAAAAEARRQQPVQPEAAQPQLDQARADQLRADQLKADQARADQLKADQARADQLKADQDRADRVKADRVKADQVKAGLSKAGQVVAGQGGSGEGRPGQGGSGAGKSKDGRPGVGGLGGGVPAQGSRVGSGRAGIPAQRQPATDLTTDPGERRIVSPGNRRQALIVAGVALALVVAGAGWVLTRGDDPAVDAGSGPAVVATSAAAAPSSAPSPSAAASPPAPSVQPAPTAAALPPGWHIYTDRTGFSLAVPQAWPVTREGTMVYFREPGGPRVLGIDQTDKPRPDPVADWTGKERQRVAAGDFPNYKRVRLEKVDYFLNAADWEFTFDGRNGRSHVNNRGFVTSPTRAYGMWWSTTDAKWAEHLADLQLVQRTFTPSG